jgi:hypothetical protein
VIRGTVTELRGQRATIQWDGTISGCRTVPPGTRVGDRVLGCGDAMPVVIERAHLVGRLEHAERLLGGGR